MFTADDLPTQTLDNFQVSVDDLVVYGTHVVNGFDLGSTDNALSPLALTAIDPSIFIANGSGSFTTASQRFTCDTANGHLFHSATGSNASERLFATLTGGAGTYREQHPLPALSGVAGDHLCCLGEASVREADRVWVSRALASSPGSFREPTSPAERERWGLAALRRSSPAVETLGCLQGSIPHHDGAVASLYRPELVVGIAAVAGIGDGSR